MRKLLTLMLLAVGLTASAQTANYSATKFVNFLGAPIGTPTYNTKGGIRVDGTTFKFHDGTDWRGLLTGSATDFVPATRTLTFNGTAVDLSANRSFTFGLNTVMQQQNYSPYALQITGATSLDLTRDGFAQFFNANTAGFYLITGNTVRSAITLQVQTGGAAGVSLNTSRMQLAKGINNNEAVRKDQLDSVGTVKTNEMFAYSAPLSHVGSGGSSHAAVTTSVNGFMTAADKIKLNAVTGTNTGDQTITTGSAGAITISGQSTVRLSSLQQASTADFPDANTPPALAGFYPYSTTTGSTNYPQVTGGGFKVYRGSGVANGSMEFNTSSSINANIIKFRTAASSSTYNSWETIESQERAATVYAPISGSTNYMPFAGGTFTGSVAGTTSSFSGTMTAAGDFIRNGAAATQRSLLFRTANSTRWALGTDNVAETGTNAGTNFGIYSYNDAGSLLGVAMSMERATSNVAFGGNVAFGTSANTTTAVRINTRVAANVGFQIQSVASQTGNFMQFIDNASTPLFYVAATGKASSAAAATAAADYIRVADAPTFAAGYVVNVTTTAFTSATLNSTYAAVTVGYRVICPNITGGGVIYTKATEAGSSDVWQSQAAPVVL